MIDWAGEAYNALKSGEDGALKILFKFARKSISFYLNHVQSIVHFSLPVEKPIYLILISLCFKIN